MKLIIDTEGKGLSELRREKNDMMKMLFTAFPAVVIHVFALRFAGRAVMELCHAWPIRWGLGGVNTCPRCQRGPAMCESCFIAGVKHLPKNAHKI